MSLPTLMLHDGTVHICVNTLVALLSYSFVLVLSHLVLEEYICYNAPVFIVQRAVADDAEMAGRVHAWYGDGDVYRMSVGSLRWSQLPSCRSVRRLIIKKNHEKILRISTLNTEFIEHAARS